MNSPPEELLAALRKAKLLDGERLLAHAVGNRARLRRCGACVGLVIFYGKCRDLLPLRIEVHGGSRNRRPADRLAVDIQCVIAARRHRGRPVLAAVCVLHIPLVVVVAVHSPAEELLAALRKAELFDGERLLAHAVGHRAGQAGRRRVLRLIVFDGKGVRGIPLCIEVNHRTGRGGFRNPLAVRVQRIAAARRHRGRPVAAAACVLHIPFSVGFAEDLPAEELLAGLNKPELLRRERILAVAVYNLARHRRSRRGFGFVVINRKGDGLRALGVVGLLNLRRDIDGTVGELVVLHRTAQLLCVAVRHDSVLFGFENRVAGDVYFAAQNVDSVRSGVHNRVVPDRGIIHIAEVNSVGSAVGDGIVLNRNLGSLNPHSVVAGIINRVSDDSVDYTVRHIDAGSAGSGNPVSVDETFASARKANRRQARVGNRVGHNGRFGVIEVQRVLSDMRTGRVGDRVGVKADRGVFAVENHAVASGKGVVSDGQLRGFHLNQIEYRADIAASVAHIVSEHLEVVALLRPQERMDIGRRVVVNRAVLHARENHAISVDSGKCIALDLHIPAFLRSDMMVSDAGGNIPEGTAGYRNVFARRPVDRNRLVRIADARKIKLNGFRDIHVSAGLPVRVGRRYEIAEHRVAYGDILRARQLDKVVAAALRQLGRCDCDILAVVEEEQTLRIQAAPAAVLACHIAVPFSAADYDVVNGLVAALRGLTGLERSVPKHRTPVVGPNDDGVVVEPKRRVGVDSEVAADMVFAGREVDDNRIRRAPRQIQSLLNRGIVILAVVGFRTDLGYRHIDDAVLRPDRIQMHGLAGSRGVAKPFLVGDQRDIVVRVGFRPLSSRGAADEPLAGSLLLRLPPEEDA